MRNVTIFKRLAALSAPLAMAALVAAPLSATGSSAYNNEHFWSAKPEGTAWVTGYGECWQSLHGPNNLEPCAAAPVPKEFVVRLNFEFDKYRLEDIVNDSELRRLNDYIDQVRATDARERISLVGHTDAKGSASYNYQLGQRRADTVRDYMVNRGIPSSDIVSVRSAGKSELLPNVDIYSVAQRRVTIEADY